MFELIKKNKVLLFTTSTLNNFAMENNDKNNNKKNEILDNSINKEIKHTFINSNSVLDANKNNYDIKFDNTKYIPINKYICVNYDFTKKIVTKATGDGNCLFNLLSSLIFNTEKYHNILRLFLCDKIKKDKDILELGEQYLKDYISRMEQNSVFGDYTIVNIFSKIFNIPIQIIDILKNKNYDINYNDECKNYLKIFYNGINHYNYGISTLTDLQEKPIKVSLENFIKYLKNKNKLDLNINSDIIENFEKICSAIDDNKKEDKSDNKKDKKEKDIKEDKSDNKKEDKNIKEDKSDINKKDKKEKDIKEDKSDINKKDKKEKDIKEDKSEGKNIEASCCVKKNIKENNTFDIYRRFFSNNNTLCNQSTLTLIIIGLLIYDIVLKNNNQIILLQTK